MDPLEEIIIEAQKAGICPDGAGAVYMAGILEYSRDYKRAHPDKGVDHAIQKVRDYLWHDKVCACKTEGFDACANKILAPNYDKTNE